MEDLTTTPDRQLEDWLFYDDARMAELAEIDGLYCPDDDGDHHHGPATCSFCREAAAHSDLRAAVKAEIARRVELDIRIEDPNEPTFEERHAPYGIEWELEQRERHGF
jgi:hypothetical protein